MRQRIIALITMGIAEKRIYPLPIKLRPPSETREEEGQCDAGSPYSHSYLVFYLVEIRLCQNRILSYVLA